MLALTNLSTYAGNMVDRDASEPQPSPVEIINGLTLDEFVTQCTTAPERTILHEGLEWFDAPITHPLVQASTRIAVGIDKDRTPSKIDIYQRNPFSPGRITCNLDDGGGSLEIRHRVPGHEGEHIERFPARERREFDLRVAELFRAYFLEPIVIPIQNDEILGDE